MVRGDTIWKLFTVALMGNNDMTGERRNGKKKLAL